MDDQLKFNTIPRQGTFGKVVDTANKNFELAKVAIDGLVYATHRNKGLFGTLDALTAACPHPANGDWALVGTSFPCALYRCENGVWVQSGTYSGDNVALNDYVLKSTYNTDKASIEGDIEELQHTVYGHSIEQEVEFEHANEGQALATTIPTGAKIFISGDLDTVLGYISNSETDYQTITSGTIADRNIGLVRCGDTYGTVTITAIVENGLENDIQAIRTDYNNFEDKLRGNGSLASAMIYPMLNLGDFTNINEVNTAIDSAFEATNTIKQGRLRLTRNGQIIFVDQFAIDYSQGRWAQMAYGMIAPSSQDEGATLIQATDHPHVVWRMNGVDSGKWHELQGNVSLKTINGNSIYGEGDLTISTAAQIVIDTTLDPSSDNAISNSAVATIVAEIYETFAEAVQQVIDEKGTIICKVWQSDVNWPSPITTPVGTWGFDTANKELLRVNASQSWQHYDLSGDVIYVDAVNNKQYRWNGSAMVSVGGGSSIAVVNTVTSGNMNAVSSNAVYQAMRQYAIDEVAVIKCWSDDSQDYDNWQEGDYWYDPIEDELWRCNDQQGTNFEKVLRPIIMLKEPGYDVWIWNTQTAKKFDVETETSISAETAESTKPPTTAAVYEKVHAIEEAIDDINMEDYRKNSDEENELLYPEYWFDVIEEEKKALDPSYEKKEIIYAKNYYDWNIVWYGGVVTSSGATSTLNADVIYPTEYLNTALTWVRGLKDTTSTKKKLMTEDVYYDSTLNQFVLLFSGTYYAKWNNSYLWNNEKDGVIVSAHPLRSDTVYCRMYPTEYLNPYTDSAGKSFIRYKADTKIVVSDVLTDIFSTFTDFKESIARCKTENNGNLRLHSTKIYGLIPSSGSSYFWNGLSDFLVDGQGSTICAVGNVYIEPMDISDNEDAYPTRVVTYPDDTHTWVRNYKEILPHALCFKSCASFTVRNIKIKAVRNTVKNTASNYPFSFASGYMHGIMLSSSSDITLKDIEYKGCAKDFELRDSGGTYSTCNKLTVDGWKSESSGGMDTGQVVLSMLMANSYVVTEPHLGVHMFYFFSTVRQLTCRNNSFIQDALFNTNFVQVKQQDPPITASNRWSTVKHIYENCYFRYARGFIYYTPYYLYEIVFKQCTFMQTDTRYNGKICYWSGKSLSSVNSSGVAMLTLNDPANVHFDSCMMAIYGQLLFMKKDSVGDFDNADWGLGKNPNLKPFYIAMTNNVIRFLDTTNIRTYASGGQIFKSSYAYYTRYIENNECNMTLPSSNGRYRFDMSEIGIAVDESFSKKSKNPLQNKVVSNVLDDVNIAMYGVPLEYTSGTFANLPKSAEVGDVYYDTTNSIYYKCVHPGSQSKARFNVARNLISGVDFVIKGTLKVYMGISQDNLEGNTYTAAEKERMCVLEVSLDSTADEELDLSTDKKVRNWIVDQINMQYPDFIYGYAESDIGKACIDGSGNDSKFSVMTDSGYNCKLNVINAVTRTANALAVYSPDDGVQNMLTLTRQTAAESTHYTPVLNQYNGAMTHIDAIIHNDSSNTDIRIADHHLSDEDLQSITSYMSNLVITTNNAEYYYIFGFDAIWEALSFDGGINGRVSTLENTKYEIPQIALWNDNYQQRSNWAIGDLWYAPTARELKICVSDQIEFEDAAPCVVANSTNLYYWTGQTLYTISATET